MDSSRTNSARRRGFTLIELLVVVGVIALLIGLLVPSLARARENARTTKCATNLRQWGIGVGLYLNSNDGFLPAKGGDGTPQNPVANWNDTTYWWNAIPSQFNNGTQTYDSMQQSTTPYAATGGSLPFYGANSMFVCPSTTETLFEGPTSPAAFPAGAVKSPNGDIRMGPYAVLYGWNAATGYAGPSDALLANDTTGTLGNAYPAEPRATFMCYVWNSKMVTNGDFANNNTICLKASTFGADSAQILMVEKRMRVDEVDAADSLNPYRGLLTPGTNNYSKPLCKVKGDWNRFSTRHRNGGNVVFADGHVELLTYHDVNKSWGGNPPLTIAGGKIISGSGDWNNPGAWVWCPFAPAQ